MFLNPLVLLFFSKYWGSKYIMAPQPNYWRGHDPLAPLSRPPWTKLRKDALCCRPVFERCTISVRKSVELYRATWRRKNIQSPSMNNRCTGYAICIFRSAFRLVWIFEDMFFNTKFILMLVVASLPSVLWRCR